MVPRRRNTSKPPPPECPLDECMRILGGAWTVQVIWYLRGGVRRFGELRFDMPRISAKTLSARLHRLERDGIVTRAVMSTSPPTVNYELSSLGQRLLPAIEGIVEVGHDIKRVRAKLATKVDPSSPATRTSTPRQRK